MVFLKSLGKCIQFTSESMGSIGRFNQQQMEINFLTAEFHKAKPECALHRQLCIVFTLNQASSGGDKAYVRMYIGYM